MSSNITGNRITANALRADGGAELIKKALKEISEHYGWQATVNDALFSGVYYDSAKVGSFIARAQDERGKTAVVKLQLHPLPFNEGFIIRWVEKENRSQYIRLPQIILDQPWRQDVGYGFLIFEDLTQLPFLWSDAFLVTPQDKQRHKTFLQEFFTNVLPITPFLETPKINITHKYIESFQHFQEIAEKSNYYHIETERVQRLREEYFQVLKNVNFSDIVFTHAHLSGLDVKYSQKDNLFIPMANLYWSFRAKYYEISFPIWVNIMQANDRSFNLEKLLLILASWMDVWSSGLYDHNPATKDQFWFNLLTQAVITTMLDLGASEWPKGQERAKQALLDSMEDFSYWIIQEKFK